MMILHFVVVVGSCQNNVHLWMMMMMMMVVVVVVGISRVMDRDQLC